MFGGKSLCFRLGGSKASLGRKPRSSSRTVRWYATKMYALLVGKQHVPELYGCQELPGGYKMMVMELSPSLQVK